MDLLKINNISKSFDSQQILKEITMKLKKGELISVLGSSGVGKTTLFQIIAGLTLPDSGQILLNGTDITGKPGMVSYMLQKDLLLPYRNILDNVTLPLLIKGEKKALAREKAQSYFAEFGLSGTEKKYPMQLSGGMRQRAALLRTYLFSGQVALLDEPFSALDQITKTTLHQWYLEVMEKIDLATIFITHDIEEAILLSDRIYILGGQPGEIQKELNITIPKPRREECLTGMEFMEYKKEILSVLKKNS